MWEEWGQFIARSLMLEKSMAWTVQVFLIVLTTLIASFLTGVVLKRLKHRLERTNTLWDDVLVASLHKPVRAIIWIVGIGFAAEVASRKTDATVFSVLPTVTELFIIVVVGWALLRFTKKGTEAIVVQQRRKGKHVDVTTVNAVENLLKATVVITTGLIMMQALGYSVNAVLTFGGIGGIAIGFAAKDLLANFFGALMIYFDRPFSVGDWIRSPDRNIEGTVEKIGWRMTTIRTFDMRPLYVPNSVFASIAVENPSRMSHRRIYETIGIRYDDISHMQAITDEIRVMLSEHEEIDESQTLIVQFNEFAASSCDFFVYAFTHTTQWVRFHEIKHEILLKIADIIAGYGAEIAYPTQTLHLPEYVGAIKSEGQKNRRARDEL